MTNSKAKTSAQTVIEYQQFAATIRKTKSLAGGIVPQLKIISVGYYYDHLNKFKDGESVSVCITNKRPKRTEQQNRYYWGVYLPLIAKEHNERDLERLHNLFKGKFLTKEIVEVFGEKVRLMKSTTNLSTAEFSEFIMNIEELTGVAAPPTENYQLEPLKRTK